ncbi:MAG: hypothetical protein JO213_18530 [Alphaproteobacteria bacterium]|nr:hypothetical protein [Alphaproteobacteria bacterium]MBV9966877.1 hypothetical protein [Alphaproteobacteria bacterium]
MKQTIASPAHEQLTASVQPLILPKGLYAFSVKAADPERVAQLGGLMLPALHVGLGPNIPTDGIEFLSTRDDGAHWLYAPGDMLVAKVIDQPVTVLLTSVGAAGMQPLAVDVNRLDPRSDSATTETHARDERPGPAEEPLRVQVTAHISNRGDVVFIDTDWAGRLGRGMSIEAFSVVPLERLGAADIEYKGLTGAGFESPWLSNGEACGTRGMGIPLVGFAVRLKPQVAAMGYQCMYRGSFRSGAISGDVSDGELCRSETTADPLEGIELRIVPPPQAPAGASEPEPVRSRQVGSG